MNLKNEIERFFVKVENTDRIDIVCINKIIRKCIKISIDIDIFLTFCVDANEHD